MRNASRLAITLLAALSLSACIHVEDLDDAWDVAMMDSALEGSWRKIGAEPAATHAMPGPEILTFRKAGLQYEVPFTEPGKKAENYAVRTIEAGNAGLLIVKFEGPGGQPPPPDFPQGWVIRYDVTGDVFRYYFPNGRRIGPLIATYSATSSIRLDDFGALIIKKFDENVRRLMMDVAKDPSYWKRTGEYRKQR
jgi:hypothetical protein